MRRFVAIAMFFAIIAPAAAQAERRWTFEELAQDMLINGGRTYHKTHPESGTFENGIQLDFSDGSAAFVAVMTDINDNLLGRHVCSRNTFKDAVKCTNADTGERTCALGWAPYQRDMIQIPCPR